MMFWKIRDRKLFFEKTLLMGVLNVTPDSFSGEGLLAAEEAAARGLEMLDQGADILDVGAESTRPGAEPVALDEERCRLLPVVESLRRKTEAPISIDTTKPEVARACLDRGAHIINDVSGLKDSGYEMARVVREYGAGLVLMHRRGGPGTMQSQAHYEDVAGEVLAELAESFEMARAAGIEEEQLVLDPGLGFAKNFEQNLEIMRQLERFQRFQRPVLLGPSRKAFIGQVTGRPAPGRDWGTAAVAAFAVLKGVQILRIHSVAAMRDVVRMTEAMQGDQHVRTL